MKILILIIVSSISVSSFADLSSQGAQVQQESQGRHIDYPPFPTGLVGKCDIGDLGLVGNDVPNVNEIEEVIEQLESKGYLYVPEETNSHRIVFGCQTSKHDLHGRLYNTINGNCQLTIYDSNNNIAVEVNRSVRNMRDKTQISVLMDLVRRIASCH